MWLMRIFPATICSCLSPNDYDQSTAHNSANSHSLSPSNTTHPINFNHSKLIKTRQSQTKMSSMVLLTLLLLFVGDIHAVDVPMELNAKLPNWDTIEYLCDGMKLEYESGLTQEQHREGARITEAWLHEKFGIEETADDYADAMWSARRGSSDWAIKHCFVTLMVKYATKTGVRNPDAFVDILFEYSKANKELKQAQTKLNEADAKVKKATSDLHDKIIEDY